VKRLLTVLVLLLVAGAFVGGYWPQRRQAELARQEAADLRRELAEARGQLEASESRHRIGRIFGQFLALHDAVAAGNFGEARPLSSAFFDQARDEVGRTTDATVRTALDAVLMRRDAVTAGLARGEAPVGEILALVERDLRRALGYPTLPLATPAPAPAPAPALPETAP
jgi:hypothetical protein